MTLFLYHREGDEAKYKSQPVKGNIQKYYEVDGSLKLEDVLPLEDDLRYEDKLSQNKIRSNIFNYKFSYASDDLNELNIKKKTIYFLNL